MKRLLLRVAAACTTHCQTCPIRDLQALGHPERTLPEVEEALARGAREGCREVVFMRGLDARRDLPALVRAARDLGYGLIQVQTHGRTLAYEGVAQTLRAAGLTHLEVTLYAAEEGLHDRLAAVPGAWAQATKGITHAVDAGLEVQIQLPLARPALATAARLPEMLAGMGIGRLQLHLPRPIPDAEGRTSSHVPTLAEATLAVHAVAQSGERAGIEVRCEGLPLCALDDLAALASDVDPESADLVIDDLHRRVEGLAPLRPLYRPFAPVCATCSVRARCPTTWSSWLERYGDAELAPITEP